jgi:hypothetical protein
MTSPKTLFELAAQVIGFETVRRVDIKDAKNAVLVERIRETQGLCLIEFASKNLNVASVNFKNRLVLWLTTTTVATEAIDELSYLRTNKDKAMREFYVNRVLPAGIEPARTEELFIAYAHANPQSPFWEDATNMDHIKTLFKTESRDIDTDKRAAMLGTHKILLAKYLFDLMPNSPPPLPYDYVPSPNITMDALSANFNFLFPLAYKLYEIHATELRGNTEKAAIMSETDELANDTTLSLLLVDPSLALPASETVKRGKIQSFLAFFHQMPRQYKQLKLLIMICRHFKPAQSYTKLEAIVPGEEPLTLLQESESYRILVRPAKTSAGGVQAPAVRPTLAPANAGEEEGTAKNLAALLGTGDIELNVKNIRDLIISGLGIPASQDEDESPSYEAFRFVIGNTTLGWSDIRTYINVLRKKTVTA